jgi:hypothetical protein
VHSHIAPRHARGERAASRHIGDAGTRGQVRCGPSLRVDRHFLRSPVRLSEAGPASPGGARHRLGFTRGEQTRLGRVPQRPNLRWRSGWELGAAWATRSLLKTRWLTRCAACRRGTALPGSSHCLGLGHLAAAGLPPTAGPGPCDQHDLDHPGGSCRGPISEFQFTVTGTSLSNAL